MKKVRKFVLHLFQKLNATINTIKVQDLFKIKIKKVQDLLGKKNDYFSCLTNTDEISKGDS